MLILNGMAGSVRQFHKGIRYPKYVGLAKWNKIEDEEDDDISVSSSLCSRGRNIVEIIVSVIDLFGQMRWMQMYGQPSVMRLRELKVVLKRWRRSLDCPYRLEEMRRTMRRVLMYQ